MLPQPSLTAQRLWPFRVQPHPNYSGNDQLLFGTLAAAQAQLSAARLPGSQQCLVWEQGSTWTATPAASSDVATCPGTLAGGVGG